MKFKFLNTRKISVNMKAKSPHYNKKTGNFKKVFQEENLPLSHNLNNLNNH